MWKLISTEGWYRPRFTWSAVATRWLIRLPCGLNEFIVHFSMPGEGDSLCVLLHLEMNRCWLCVLEGMQTLTQRRVTCKTAGCYTSSRIGNQAFSSHSDLLRVYIVLSLPLVQNARAQWNESAAYLSSIWICMGRYDWRCEAVRLIINNSTPCVQLLVAAPALSVYLCDLVFSEWEPLLVLIKHH